MKKTEHTIAGVVFPTFERGGTKMRLLRKIGAVYLIRNILKLYDRRALTPGISLFGINVFRDPNVRAGGYRGVAALRYILENLHPKSGLDIGSGGGYHAKALQNSGCRMCCVDYGTSIYAQESKFVDDVEVIKVDFNEYKSEKRYDLVWASHVLEHQRNVGRFLEKLIEACADNGHVCITVPDMHRLLFGGHLSLWTPGLLAYNVLLCGIDLSEAVFIRGNGEFSLLFNPKRIALPSELTFDNGDLRLLSKYLPPKLREDGDPWDVDFV